MNQTSEDSIARQGIRQMIRRINKAIEKMDKGMDVRRNYFGPQGLPPYLTKNQERLEKYLGKSQEQLEMAIKIGYEIIGPDEKTNLPG